MPKPVTPTTTTTTDFNITVQLGNNIENIVTLYAADLDKVAEKGLHFALPAGSSITVGTLKDLIVWINTKLGSDGSIPTAAGDGWPTEIQNIFNGVLNVSTAVTKFTFDQAPKGADDTYPAPEFSLAVTGTAMDPANPTEEKPIPFGGIFSVVGGGVGVTRTNTAAKA